MEDQYVAFVGVFDQKLGPVCLAPREQCELFLGHWPDPRGIIQDGINTSAKVFTIHGQDHIIQVHKFALANPALRGGTQRCALFCVVPPTFPVLMEEVLAQQASKVLAIAERNGKDLGCEECDVFLSQWVAGLNASLRGDIGKGRLEHLVRDLSNSIIGYSQLVLDGALGSLTDEQRDAMTCILAYARKALCAVVTCIKSEGPGSPTPGTCPLP